jgi:hypothetical protein
MGNMIANPSLPPPLNRTALPMPRSAAIDGILFPVLLIRSLWLQQVSILAEAARLGVWVSENAGQLSLALNLIPIATVSFIWFLDVPRDWHGAREDQFFATVRLGSGLMFLGMMFVVPSTVNALIVTCGNPSSTPLDAADYILDRNFIRSLMHIYAFKFAAVFMMSASTVGLYLRLMPWWIALLGHASAVLRLFANAYFDWALFVFHHGWRWLAWISRPTHRGTPQRQWRHVMFERVPSFSWYRACVAMATA